MKKRRMSAEQVRTDSQLRTLRTVGDRCKLLFVSGASHFFDGIEAFSD